MGSNLGSLAPRPAFLMAMTYYVSNAKRLFLYIAVNTASSSVEDAPNTVMLSPTAHGVKI